jgi:hypothetical protein
MDSLLQRQKNLTFRNETAASEVSSMRAKLRSETADFRTDAANVSTIQTVSQHAEYADVAN